MRHEDGTYDLTVDDIHEIRVENSKLFEKMTSKEICEYIQKGADEFLSFGKQQAYL